MSHSDNVTNSDLGVFEAEIQRLVDKIKDLEDDMRRAEVLADSQQEAYYYNIRVEEDGDRYVLSAAGLLGIFSFGFGMGLLVSVFIASVTGGGW